MVLGMEIALWVLLIAASYTDITYRKIPNRLTFTFIVLGLLSQTVVQGIPGLSQSGLAVGAAFILFFPLFATRVFSAGDVKLLMAAGSFLTTAQTLRLALSSIVVGAIVGLFVLIGERGVSAAIGQVRGHLSLQRPKVEGTYIPFAPAVLCAFTLLKIAEVLAWI